ncbi:rhodanese-like domain-containing protein [Sulfurovum sp.]|uniref:rhodanese-like domain-containing protein n=1 Tax=Sulfurovum sp. TaxID=1969726 RepID=UPI0035617D24
MFKIIFLCIIFISFSKGDNTSSHMSSVGTDHINSSGEIQHITIKREIDPLCKNIHITNEMFWQSKYASKSVPDVCKSTFITSAGKTIYPMQLHKGVETYGEVEVLAFIKQMQEDNTMLMIDTRDEEWYEYRTIPGAMNIHYVYIMMTIVFEEEYKVSLEKLGIIGNKKSYDFSQAKTILVFCNGAWCSQSPKMVKALLTLGYPPEKIKWYRGGMDDWLGLSMTTTKKYQL